MTGRRARAACAVGALALVACLVACGGEDPEPDPGVRWSQVELPDGVAPLLVVAVESELVVAAEATGLPTPRMFAIDADGALTPVPVDADSYYGQRAQWFDVATSGGELMALGQRPGGAHGNPRWSTWEGGVDGVVEQPEQPIYVFGGWGAGGLAGIAIAREGPVIVGGRAGAESGLDIVLWLPDGDDWVEQSSAGTELAATADLRPVATDVVTDGGELLITGMAQHGTEVGAAVWRAPGPAGPWQRIALPGAGRVVTAQSALCDGGSCLVVGRVDGAVVGWWVDGAEVTPADLPDVPDGDATDTVLPPVRWAGSVTLVLPDGGDTVVAVEDGDRWRLVDGPPGMPAAAAAVGERLYVVTSQGGQATLWERPAG